MEYCCHVWAGAPSCYLEMIDKLQKQIYRIVGPLLAAPLESLTYCPSVASLSLSIGITLIVVHLSWFNWFHFLILEGGLLVILMSPFLDVIRTSVLTVSFLPNQDSGILCQ